MGFYSSSHAVPELNIGILDSVMVIGLTLDYQTDFVKVRV